MVNKKMLGLVLLGLFLAQTVYAAGPAAVNLGTAGNFAILSKSGISTTGTTSIIGNLGVSPITSTAITGFGLIMDSSNQFSTSSLVAGRVYAADYAVPTPDNMTVAIDNMETAYTDAAGRTNPTATELGAGNIGGMTLAPGLYKWGTGVAIPTNVTLSGGSNDVWIFQIAQTLKVGNGVHVILSGGAQAKNIFWQVGGQVSLGTTSEFKGIILSQTAIVIKTGARLNGRALAQTAVTLDAAMAVAPGRNNLNWGIADANVITDFNRITTANKTAKTRVTSNALPIPAKALSPMPAKPPTLVAAAMPDQKPLAVSASVLAIQLSPNFWELVDKAGKQKKLTRVGSYWSPNYGKIIFP